MTIRFFEKLSRLVVGKVLYSTIKEENDWETAYHSARRDPPWQLLEVRMKNVRATPIHECHCRSACNTETNGTRDLDFVDGRSISHISR